MPRTDQMQHCLDPANPLLINSPLRRPTAHASGTSHGQFPSRPVTAQELRLVLGGLDSVQLPSVSDALELAPAAVIEGEAGPGDQVLDRARAQDLPGPGLAHDPGRDVDRDATDVVTDQLDLPGVQPNPDLEAMLG
jgi:hypothetical protein